MLWTRLLLLVLRLLVLLLMLILLMLILLMLRSIVLENRCYVSHLVLMTDMSCRIPLNRGSSVFGLRLNGMCFTFFPLKRPISFRGRAIILSQPSFTDTFFKTHPHVHHLGEIRGSTCYHPLVIK